MDAIDRKILAVMQEDASLSVAEIGNRVGLSSTPCWKRIQKLEAEGVIQKRVAVVDQAKIGLGITVYVSVETDDHSQDWIDRFAKVVGAMPEVMEFYRMAGDVDYMLRVRRARHRRLRRVLQAADRDRSAEERHVAFRNGKDQVDDGAADRLRHNPKATRSARGARHGVGHARAHVDLILERQRAGHDMADHRLVGVLHLAPDQRRVGNGERRRQCHGGAL